MCYTEIRYNKQMMCYTEICYNKTDDVLYWNPL